jgi:hypothetical protein
MTVPVTREQAQAVAAAAAAERDAVQANLLDLDSSFGKRLLAGAVLSGESRRQWESTSADLASLWDEFSAYSAVIDRAAELLATPGRMRQEQVAQAVDLILGPSVVLAKQVSPLAERDLTAASERRLTPATAVAEMKRVFPVIARVLAAAESTWNEVSDGLRQVADDLDDARRNAADLAGPGEARDTQLAEQLAQADAGLRQLRDTLNCDPLSLWQHGRVDTRPLDRLRERAAAARAGYAGLRKTREQADQRIADVSATVAAARQAWQDAMAARQRAAARVSVATMTALPDVSGLGGRLDGLTKLKDAARWARLESELDDLAKLGSTALRECRQAEQAAADLIGRRDELRGLLDAYRAKAGRSGAAEDRGLEDVYGRARDLLWTAPCDLTAAAEAVTGYQQAVLRLSRTGELA